MHRDKERQDVINWQLRTCQTCRVHRLCWSASLLHFTGMRCTTWRARVPMITKCRLGQVSLGWLQPQPRRHATRWWIVSARFVMVGHVLFATRKYWLYLKQNSAQLMMMRWWYFINIIYIWSKLAWLLIRHSRSYEDCTKKIPPFLEVVNQGRRFIFLIHCNTFWHR